MNGSHRPRFFSTLSCSNLSSLLSCFFVNFFLISKDREKGDLVAACLLDDYERTIDTLLRNRLLNLGVQAEELSGNLTGQQLGGG